MLNIQISIGTTVEDICSVNTLLTVDEIWTRVLNTMGISREDFYILNNGKLVSDTDVCSNGYATIVPRLLGGKGGFGSMLRAIGAQIEKTTNREACRDLSGRRLRDINEEKRLKAWIEKQGKREEESAERRKRKLQKLCAEPKHEFTDKNYDHERSILTERVGDAVEEGFKVATASGSGIKRKAEDNFKPNKKMLLDLDIDSDELGSTDDSDTDNDVNETKAASLNKVFQPVSTDSGHSSDEYGRISRSVIGNEMEHSESSSDNHSITDNSDKSSKTKHSEISQNDSQSSSKRVEESQEEKKTLEGITDEADK